MQCQKGLGTFSIDLQRGHRSSISTQRCKHGLDKDEKGIDAHTAAQGTSVEVG